MSMTEDANRRAFTADEAKEKSADLKREALIRTVMDPVELRDATEERDGRLGTLHGHFAKFNQWTKIDSTHEGRFMEQIAPGTFTKTFAENRSGMRVLYNHGKDNQVGEKPLGPITDLREDAVGAYYEVPLLDTSYNRDLLPLLDAGLLGASFRFRVMRDDIQRRCPETDWNPDGLPQRTIHEAHVREFGPVTFPAYEGATAGIRSMTDEFLFWEMSQTISRLSDYADWAQKARDALVEVDTSAAGSYNESGSTEPHAPLEARRPWTPPASGRRGEVDKAANEWPPRPRNQRRIPTSWDGV